MRIKETMTPEELYAYREYSGCSMQEIKKTQTKLMMLRLVGEVESWQDTNALLARVIQDLY